MDTQKSIRIDPPGGVAGAVIAALWIAICLHCFIRILKKSWAIGNRGYTNFRPPIALLCETLCERAPRRLMKIMLLKPT